MAPDTIKTTPPAGGAAERDPRIVPAEPAGELARAVLPAPPVLTCPACGGALQEDQERDLARYVCHVGHAYSPHALAAAEDERIEAALWSAVRALKERAELHHRLAQHARTARLTGLVRKTQETAADMEARAATIVKMLLQSNSPPATERRPPRAPAARQRATPARTRPRRPRPAGRAGSPRPRRKAGRRR